MKGRMKFAVLELAEDVYIPKSILNPKRRTQEVKFIYY
jgi:hypothetical protein